MLPQSEATASPPPAPRALPRRRTPSTRKRKRKRRRRRRRRARAMMINIELTKQAEWLLRSGPCCADAKAATFARPSRAAAAAKQRGATNEGGKAMSKSSPSQAGLSGISRKTLDAIPYDRENAITLTRVGSEVRRPGFTTPTQGIQAARDLLRHDHLIGFAKGAQNISILPAPNHGPAMGRGTATPSRAPQRSPSREATADQRL
jgi:hypothetical protein